MAINNPPTKSVAFTTTITLRSASDNISMISNPTIAVGDFQISKDGGVFANLTTLPVVSPAAGVGVTIALSATEMNADRVLITGIDQTATKEWVDFSLTIMTSA